MARPRKQVSERAECVCATAMTVSSPSSAQSEGFVYNGERTYAPKVYAQGCYVVYAPTDIELRRGRVVVPLEIKLSGFGGIITDTPDNARYGIRVHNGQRMVKSHIIPVIATGELEAVISVEEETLFTEKTALGTRTRNVFIKAGEPIAKLAIVKV